mgnify:FL=1
MHEFNILMTFGAVSAVYLIVFFSCEAMFMRDPKEKK